MAETIRDVVLRLTLETKPAKIDLSGLKALEKASTQASKGLNQDFRKMEKSVEVLEKRLKKLEGQLKSTGETDLVSASGIRSQKGFNKELKEGTRLFTRIQDASIRAGEGFRQASDGAFQLARGVAFSTAANEDNLKATIQMIARWQSMFDIFKGGTVILTGLTKQFRALRVVALATQAAAGGGAAFAGSAAGRGARRGFGSGLIEFLGAAGGGAAVSSIGRGGGLTQTLSRSAQTARALRLSTPRALRFIGGQVLRTTAARGGLAAAGAALAVGGVIAVGRQHQRLRRQEEEARLSLAAQQANIDPFGADLTSRLSLARGQLQGRQDRITGLQNAFSQLGAQAGQLGLLANRRKGGPAGGPFSFGIENRRGLLAERGRLFERQLNLLEDINRERQSGFDIRQRELQDQEKVLRNLDSQLAKERTIVNERQRNRERDLNILLGGLRPGAINRLRRLEQQGGVQNLRDVRIARDILGNQAGGIVNPFLANRGVQFRQQLPQLADQIFRPGREADQRRIDQLVIERGQRLAEFGRNLPQILQAQQDIETEISEFRREEIERLTNILTAVKDTRQEVALLDIEIAKLNRD